MGFYREGFQRMDLLSQRNDGCHDGCPKKDVHHCLKRMLQTDDVSSEFFGVQCVFAGWNMVLQRNEVNQLPRMGLCTGEIDGDTINMYRVH